MADILGYLSSYFKIIRAQIDVISDKRHTGSDGYGSRGGMTFGGTEIRLPFGKFYFLSHSFKFAFANSSQILPVRCSGRLFIQEDRKVV